MHFIHVTLIHGFVLYVQRYSVLFTLQPKHQVRNLSSNKLNTENGSGDVDRVRQLLPIITVLLILARH